MIPIDFMHLPELCVVLRMSVTGASAPWHPEEVERALRILRHRRDNWKPTVRTDCVVFDEAVRLMVVDTVELVERLRSVHAMERR